MFECMGIMKKLRKKRTVNENQRQDDRQKEWWEGRERKTCLWKTEGWWANRVWAILSIATPDLPISNRDEWNYNQVSVEKNEKWVNVDGIVVWEDEEEKSMVGKLCIF